MVRWYHQFNGHEFEQTLEIVKEREAWYAAVHGVAKNRTYDLGHTTEHKGNMSPEPQTGGKNAIASRTTAFIYLSLYLFISFFIL